MRTVGLRRHVFYPQNCWGPAVRMEQGALCNVIGSEIVRLPVRRFYFWKLYTGDIHGARARAWPLHTGICRIISFQIVLERPSSGTVCLALEGH